MPGMIISITGIDLAGKHTQSELLAGKLRKYGYRVSSYSYPDYNSVYGRIIRDYLEKKITMGTGELFLIFLADMMKDKERIEREISTGSVIITDRYFVDTIAYQSAGGLDCAMLKAVEDAMGLPKPGMVVYIDIPASVATERKATHGGRPDKYEEDAAYLEKARRAYEELFEEHYTGAEWIKIDGTDGIDNIHHRISEHAVRLLEAKKVPQAI